MKVILPTMIFMSLFAATSCNKSERVIFEGGWAIAACGEDKTDCSLNKVEAIADHGMFSARWSCENAVQRWKRMGANLGNPRCIPCKKIIIEPGVLDSFKCEWLE